jgi:carboxylesterase
MCPPLRLHPGEIAAVRLARYLVPFVPGWLHDIPLRHWQAVRQVRHACSWIPLGPVVSLLRALPGLGQELPQIRQPALVICARHDHVVPARDGMLTFTLLGSTQKELVILERSFHEVLHDIEQPRVEASIRRFCTHIASQEPAGSPSAILRTRIDR